MRFIRGQVERGEKDGVLHFQYAMNFKNPVRLSALKKHCAHSHFEKIKVDNGAFDYCKKAETRVVGPWEFGEPPLKVNCKLDMKEKNAKILALGAKGAVDEGLIALEKIQKIQTAITIYNSLA